MLTTNELKSTLHYNPNTGIFTRIKTDDIAGCLNTIGYKQISVKNKIYYAHRLAWMYIYGQFPDGHIDHINHNRSDNRIDNLRVVSQIDNQRNQKISSRNTSGTTGVSWDRFRNRWKARIGGKNLGSFTSKEDAIIARKIAQEEHGYHQNHGE